jgi:hypothetical protein
VIRASLLRAVGLPIKAGDAQEVVVEYGMSLDTLYSMLGAFSSTDGFTREIHDLITKVEFCLASLEDER